MLIVTRRSVRAKNSAQYFPEMEEPSCMCGGWGKRHKITWENRLVTWESWWANAFGSSWVVLIGSREICYQLELPMFCLRALSLPWCSWPLRELLSVVSKIDQRSKSRWNFCCLTQGLTQRLDWPRTCCVYQAGLQLLDLSVSWVLQCPTGQVV